MSFNFPVPCSARRSHRTYLLFSASAFAFAVVFLAVLEKNLCFLFSLFWKRTFAFCFLYFGKEPSFFVFFILEKNLCFLFSLFWKKSICFLFSLFWKRTFAFCFLDLGK